MKLFSLVFSDKEAVAGLLDDLGGIEPGKTQVTWSAVATVKIKYNPEDLSKIWVWNRVTRRYVALPCTMPRYAQGLTLWQHRQVRAWAAKENLTFNTEDERLAALKGLSDRILELAPSASARERRAIARMIGSDKAATVKQEIPGMPWEDLQTTVVHEAAADTRTDSEIRRGPAVDDDDEATEGAPTPDDDGRADETQNLFEAEEGPLDPGPEDEDRKWEDYA